MGKSDTHAALSGAKSGAATTFGQVDPGLVEFSKTGGVSPEESDLARRETSYGIRGLYDQLQQNLDQRKRIQGGYSPGYGATSASLARGASEGIARGITGTNLGLLEQQRQGRLAGLSGLSNLFQTYQNQIPGLATRPGFGTNLLQGLQAAGGAVAGYEESQ